MSYADIRSKKVTASHLKKPGDRKLSTDEVENRILTERKSSLRVVIPSNSSVYYGH